MSETGAMNQLQMFRPLPFIFASYVKKLNVIQHSQSFWKRYGEQAIVSMFKSKISRPCGEVFFGQFLDFFKKWLMEYLALPLTLK